MNRNVFEWDILDFIMAVSSFVLAFLFIGMVLFTHEGVGVTIFATLYILWTLVFLYKKKMKMSIESIFWGAVLFLIALSFSLWEGKSLGGLRPFVLLLSAIYWVLVSTKSTFYGNTSDWLVYDVFTGMIIKPLSRLHLQYNCLLTFLRGKIKLRSNFILTVLGIFIALSFIQLLAPLLIGADAGGLRDLIYRLNLSEFRLPSIEPQLVLQFILTIPTATYMFALLINIKKSEGDDIEREKALRIVKNIKVIPQTTIMTAFGILTVFYLIFLGTQVANYISVLQGRIPSGWYSYAEFARRGFFELLGITFLNLGFIFFAHLFTKETTVSRKAFKIFITILASISLILALGAAARLFLYVERFGLTFMRVLPALFMLFLMVTLIGVIISQFKKISIMRLSAFSGALMLCFLFCFNIDGFVANYNADRYIDGTLEEFDVGVLWGAGVAGVPAALNILRETTDQDVRVKVETFLDEAGLMMTTRTKNSILDTFQHIQARRLLKSESSELE